MSSPSPAPSGTSTLNQLPHYLRKYRLTVTYVDGSQVVLADSQEEPRALRITFDVLMTAYQTAYWYADIAVYNCDQKQTAQLLGSQAQSTEVKLEAGYLNGVYGTIWDGRLLQAFVEREDVTDYKVTLHCLLFLAMPTAQDQVGWTTAAGVQQLDMVKRLAEMLYARNGMTTAATQVSARLKDTRLPRGKVFFGNPDSYLSQIAADNGMVWWLSKKGLALDSPAEDAVTVPDSSAIPFAPPALNAHGVGPGFAVPARAGLIVGVPTQTQFGLDFTALLDARLSVEKPLVKVKIDNSQVRFFKLQLGQLIRPLDRDGVYIVGAVRHVGDSRGSDWYSQAVCFAALEDILSQMGLTGP